MTDDVGLLDWWTSVRPFILEHAPSVAAQIDNEAARLSRLSVESEPFFICTLGQSAVGKSTLLNSIVAGSNSILPAGGIGPLTALATEVSFSEEPFFRITYRDRKQLDGFRLRLENALRKQNTSVPIADSDTSLEDDAVNTVSLYPLDAPTDEQRAAESAFSELRKQVAQLISGNQFREITLSEMVVAYRAMLGLKTGESTVNPEFASFIESANRILMRDRAVTEVTYARADLGNAFEKILRDHVSGHLAPLVEKLVVGYPSALLKSGIVLVDLPGVGVASDRYRAITQEYVRSNANAIVLVVDRAGPTSESVDLLRDSGYWDRLLLSSEDPENDPCSLLLVVTKIDDVARSEYQNTNNLPKSERPKISTLFADLRAQVQIRIREQAEKCFSAFTADPTTDGDLGSSRSTLDTELGAARKNAQETLLKSLRVFPVSAIEYRSFLEQDDEMPSFLRNAEASGVPELVAHIEELAAERRKRINAIRLAVEQRLARTIISTLGQIKSTWSNKSRAEQEADLLRQDLERFLAPKKIEIAGRAGEFRKFLQSTKSTRISELVAKAQLAAQAEVTVYLRGLRTEHWGTLRATVTRGGAFASKTGRRIDLVADLAQRFQEPMAAIWGRTLLKDIRLETKSYGEALEQIVAEICEWADNRNDTVVQRKVLASQRELLADRVAQLGQVGNEAVDELKAAIKLQLSSNIEGPIRKKCEEFRDRGEAMGPGVKNRILELFDKLSVEAVAAAGQPATKLLQDRFNAVMIEILKALDDWGDPLQQASDAIVEREEQRQQRSDSRKRAAILAETEKQMEMVPTRFASLLEAVAG